MALQLSLSLIAAPDPVRLETREVEGYEFTLGRGHDVDWSLLDPDRNILSRRHCVFVQEDGDWWVEDMSGNGTYLNHATVPIGPGARQRLRDGDRVRLGPYEFQVSFTATSRPPAPRPASSEAGDARKRPSPRPGNPFGEATDSPSEGTAGLSGPPFPLEEPPPTAPSFRPSPPPRAMANPFAGGDGDATPWDDTAEEAWPPRAAPSGGAPPPQPELAQPGGRNPFAQGAPAPAPAPARTVPNPFLDAADSPPLPVANLDAPRADEPRSDAAAEPVATAPPRQPAISPPPRPAPAAASPAAAFPARGEPDRLLPALLEGAGLPDVRPPDPEQSMRALGAAFRAMVKGVRDAQRTRRDVRGEFRIAQTSFTQNPLKTAVSDDDAMEALLGAGRRTTMPAPRAVEEVLREIVQHELATFAAMQDAIRVLVESLSPEKLRVLAEQSGGLTLLPAQRKARAWDLYEAEHARVSEALRDDFDSVFGKAFARAYERVVSEQGP